MILTKEQVDKRVSSKENIVTAEKTKERVTEVIIKDGINNHKGNSGARALTEEERIVIGTVAGMTDAKTAAEMFGVHPSHANDLKNGNRNTNEGRIRDTSLINAVSERLEETKLSIQEKAAQKLMESLGLISNDKLENSSAKELADISTKMSQVVRNLAPAQRESGSQSRPVQIILHQPKSSREEQFEVIAIGVK